MAGAERTILLSDEEKTVAVYLVIALAIAIGAGILSLALVIRALPGAGAAVDVPKLAVALAVMAVTWSAILFAAFGRWPGTVTSRAEIHVSAMPHEVWDAVALRADYPGWKPIYTGIERLAEPGEVYRLHYADDSDCPRCTLPRDPDRTRWTSRAEVVEARRPSLYRLRSFPKWPSARPGPEDRVLDCEETAMILEPVAGGATRISFGSIVVRPKMWMAFLTLLGRPNRQHLRSLKAHLEGTPDLTLFGISGQRLQAARDAPRRCACPEG